MTQPAAQSVTGTAAARVLGTAPCSRCSEPCHRTTYIDGCLVCLKCFNAAFAEKPRARWVIDVCTTCDRLAIWPFCEHRQSDGAWTRVVTVQEVGRRA